MAAFAPEGSYPEGPGYWSYGTSYNVLLISVLESALGSCFGLDHAPGFDQTGAYLGAHHGAVGIHDQLRRRGKGLAMLLSLSSSHRPPQMNNE